jgi:GT2 family glycosyltransferase
MRHLSLIFVTYNRKELLYKALKSAQIQSVPVEIIVMDDASDDGTEFMIRSEFPEIIYCKSDKNYGPAFQRNEGAKIATSDIIFFFDDDTLINDYCTIEKTLDDFNNTSIGAVTIPFINVLQNNIINKGAPDSEKDYILHSFVAAAFAVRREIFITLKGFRAEYFYMGEEGDFCLRLLESGYVVKAGTSKPVSHYQPVNRVSFRADFYGRRNDILFLYLNAPILQLPFSIIYTILRGVLHGLKRNLLKFACVGLIAGLRLIMMKNIRVLRKPLKNSIYNKFRYLKKNEPVLLDEFLCLS